MGLTTREGVALSAIPRSEARQKLLGFTGTWSTTLSATLANKYFQVRRGCIMPCVLQCRSGEWVAGGKQDV